MKLRKHQRQTHGIAEIITGSKTPVTGCDYEEEAGIRIAEGRLRVPAVMLQRRERNGRQLRLT